MTPHDRPLLIGSLIFEGIDQIDLTGPFEVFARLPGATVRLYSPDGAPVRDVRGLRLVPDGAIAEAPQLDVLHVPGGAGQEELMRHEAVLGWLRDQAAGADIVFSVCTGALLLGAAGLLRGRRATTYWSAVDLLPLFGATPVDERVVIDGRWIFAAGVTAGIDGALHLAACLRGEEIAQAIQLMMQYAPEPPFDSGTPRTASPGTVATVRKASSALIARREATARAIAADLGIAIPTGTP